ncbi:MAG: DUF2917 domain-containing protein [Ramlibacter sp.]
MHTEDSLQFAQERLSHHSLAQLGLRKRPRVWRRFAIEVPKGQARVFERVDRSVQVRCAAGSLWITHDGDCKDVVLGAQETYRADREHAMHLFALEASIVELEFEDEVLAS